MQKYTQVKWQVILQTEYEVAVVSTLSHSKFV